MIFTQQHRLPQTVRRCIQFSVFELSQPEIQEQIPVPQSKLYGTLILPDLRRSVTYHSLRKIQVIMSECVVRTPAHDFGVKTNRLRIVFDAQRIVRTDITYLLLASARACAAREAQ